MARKSVPVTLIKPNDDEQSVISAGGDTGGGNSGDNSTPGVNEPTINGFPAIDATAPIDAGTDPDTSGSGSEPPKRRRGRPAGSTNAAQKAKPRNLATGIEKMLFSIHLMGAGFFSTPELMLTPSEAEQYGIAVADVASYYNAVIDPRTLAWINLCMVAGGIYGSRMMAIRARLKAEAEMKPTKVTQFPRPSQPNQPAAATTGPGTGPTVARTPADVFGLGYSGSQSEALGD